MGVFDNLIPSASNKDELDEVLLRWPRTQVDCTHAQAAESFFIGGRPGSAKSTAVVNTIQRNMFQKDYGVVRFCSKQGEAAEVIRAVKKAGREKDLVHFSVNSDECFGFLEYEMSRQGEGAGDPINTAYLLSQLGEITQNFDGTGDSKGSDPFWIQGLRRLNTESTRLLNLAGLEVSIKNMKRLVDNHFDEQDAAKFSRLQSELQDKSLESEARLRSFKEYEKFVRQNFLLEAFERANTSELSDEQVEELQAVGDYFFKSLARLSEKTRSIILESFYGLIQPFESPLLKKKFSGGVSENLRPEKLYQEGKIIVVDFPAKEFGVSGLLAAGIYKLAVQAAMERRCVNEETNPRMVGIIIDEYAHVCSPHYDSLFLTTARSSMVSCVLVSQNINNLIYAMGTKNPEARAKALLGNIGTKIFCNNSCYDTNEYASQMIGEEYVETESMVVDADQKRSQSFNLEKRRKVPVEDFTTLKTGRGFGGKAEAIVFHPGTLWGDDNQNYGRVEFDQDI